LGWFVGSFFVLWGGGVLTRHLSSFCSRLFFDSPPHNGTQPSCPGRQRLLPCRAEGVSQDDERDPIRLPLEPPCHVRRVPFCTLAILSRWSATDGHPPQRIPARQAAKRTSQRSLNFPDSDPIVPPARVPPSTFPLFKRSPPIPSPNRLIRQRREPPWPSAAFRDPGLGCLVILSPTPPPPIFLDRLQHDDGRLVWRTHQHLHRQPSRWCTCISRPTFPPHAEQTVFFFLFKSSVKTALVF